MGGWFDHTGLPVVHPDDVVTNDTIKNIRKTFSKEKITQLAESIYAEGLMHPPIVVETDLGGGESQYELIAGAQRLAAIKQIRKEIDPSFMEEMPYIQFDGNLSDAVFANALENLDREDLNDVDIAEWLFERVNGEDPIERSEISQRLHRSEAWISQHVTFVENACPMLIEAVRTGMISFSAGYELSKKSKEVQERFLKSNQKTWDKLTAEDARNSDNPDKTRKPTKKAIENRLSQVTRMLEGDPNNAGLRGIEMTLRWVTGLLTSVEFDEVIRLTSGEEGEVGEE